MAGASKTREKTQLIGGLIALVMAIALLAGMVMCMSRCVAQFPVPTEMSTTVAPETLPTPAPVPTLAPNPYGPGDFAYDHGYLTCISGESWLGVDVSEHQGVINWEQVAAAGVRFAMIRVGFRAWGSEGELHEDAYWRENMAGAKAAGLMVGAYFFSQAISEEEALEEAQFMLSLLDGTYLDMPVVFDWETISDPDARTGEMTRSVLNVCTLAFCQEVEKAGYKPLVYFNQDLARRMFDLQTLQDAGYGFWLAMYNNTMTYPYQLAMWQYSNVGSVPGISTNVDLNLYFIYE